MTSIDLATITAIADEAEAADGAAPLDEATWLALRHRADRVRSRVREDGFALLVEGTLSLVVRPSARGRGLGRELLDEALAVAGDQPLTAWSHGNHPAAAALGAATGFRRVRDLWVMRRPTSLPLPDEPEEPEEPEEPGEPGPGEPNGVRIRSYTPADAEALLAVNAAAFAEHPEQGAMSAGDLATRMAEPWFDPEGLLVAVDADDRIVGFHWTKQHSPERGEVYVVGIAPGAQGGGLGRRLTLAGLRHLAGRGVDEVILYVESDNAPALAVYSRLGFTHADVDTHVMYAR